MGRVKSGAAWGSAPSGPQGLLQPVEEEEERERESPMHTIMTTVFSSDSHLCYMLWF